MLTKTDTIRDKVETWLADLAQALAASRDADLRALFLPDCHWRDVLALTWTIQTLGGRDTVVGALMGCASRARPKVLVFEPRVGRQAGVCKFPSGKAQCGSSSLVRPVFSKGWGQHI